MTDRSFCVGCEKFGVCALEPLSRHCTLKYRPKDKRSLTNADDIRTKSDEELARFFYYKIFEFKYKENYTVEEWLNWLQSPAAN